MKLIFAESLLIIIHKLVAFCLSGIFSSVHIQEVGVSCVHHRGRWERMFIERLPSPGPCYPEVDTVDTLPLQAQRVKWSGQMVWCGKHCLGCYTGCLHCAVTGDMGDTEEALLKGWQPGWPFHAARWPSVYPCWVLLATSPWPSFQLFSSIRPPTHLLLPPLRIVGLLLHQENKGQWGSISSCSPAVLWPASYHSQIPPVTEPLSSCVSVIVCQSTSISSLSPTSPPLRPSPHTL